MSISIIVLGIICAVVFLLGGLVIGIGAIMYKSITSVTQKDKVSCHTEEFLRSGGFNMNAFLDTHAAIMTNVSVRSRHGHTISADYFKIDNTADRHTIVLVHGIGNDRRSMYPLADMLIKNGFNVFTYDQRATGGNTAKTVTFGYYESDDLEDCLSFIRPQVGPDSLIGVLGQSMGAATAAFFSGKPEACEYLDFMILDSPYSDMGDLVKWTLADRHVPLSGNFAVFCGNVYLWLKLRFTYADMAIVRNASRSTIPALVIHSRTDEVCPYFMGERIYNVLRHADKKMWILDTCEHIKSIYAYPEKYTEQVVSFISKIASSKQTIKSAMSDQKEFGS